MTFSRLTCPPRVLTLACFSSHFGWNFSVFGLSLSGAARIPEFLLPGRPVAHTVATSQYVPSVRAPPAICQWGRLHRHQMSAFLPTVHILIKRHILTKNISIHLASASTTAPQDLSWPLLLASTQRRRESIR